MKLNSENTHNKRSFMRKIECKNRSVRGQLSFVTLSVLLQYSAGERTTACEVMTLNAEVK
ncbi:MAG: hypothetical protein AYK19_18565 [Theionarchaea archaeon DG-70-1]|nr:MAG: hypothetical protein AYK19_18565 [Theionarchaea archaeon DG-70-1]